MKSVSIIQCENYDYEKVEKAVFECLDNLSEIKNVIKKDARVLVKVNLLKKNLPEDAVTTHPAVAEAIVRYLQGMGCRVIVGDSPGGAFTKKRLEEIYRAAGMLKVAEKTGCELNYDTSEVEILNPKAEKLKRMQIIKIAEEVDFVVSAAKLKTHGMMMYTGAVKNLFGVIPGLTKAEYHLKMISIENFADHLVDICEYIAPVFSVIDAVDGMEGDGPSAGEKRHVGLIMASENPYVLDVAAAHLIGLKPSQVPTIQVAVERGLCSGEFEDVTVQGCPPETLQIPPFKLPKSFNQGLLGGKVPKFLENYLINALRSKPVINYNKCISCGECQRGCPAGIIDMSSGKPKPDLGKCISCFCCHELCPVKAVDIKRHWLHRKLFKR
ncbi:MAG: DUF362 domain-containing protein [Anaerocolumna sp.]